MNAPSLKLSGLTLLLATGAIFVCAGCGSDGDEPSNDKSTISSPDPGAYTLYSSSQVDALEDSLSKLPFQVTVLSSKEDRKQRVFRATARDEDGNRLQFVIKFGTENANLEKYFQSADKSSYEHESIPGIGTLATSSPDSGYGMTASMYAQMVDTACITFRGESCNLP